MFLKGSLLLQVQQAFRNSRRDSGSSVGHAKITPLKLATVNVRKTTPQAVTKQVDTVGYQRIIKEMKTECEKERPNENIISSLMESTFLKRKEWITSEETMTVGLICHEFPALKLPYVVSLNAHPRPNISIVDIQTAWLSRATLLLSNGNSSQPVVCCFHW